MAKKKKQWYDDEYYEWKEYSDYCPWKFGAVCKATTMICNYTKCAPWHFLKTYKILYKLTPEGIIMGDKTSHSLENIQIKGDD